MRPPSVPARFSALRHMLAAACLAALGACAADPVTEPPVTPAGVAAVSRSADPHSAAEALYVTAIRLRLERAAAGLLYTSESDYPFTFYHRSARTTAPLTVAVFRATAGVPADSVVDEVSLDSFLARHIERVDPADSAAVALVPRYRALKRALRETVRSPRVFRVGRIAIRCYVVGVDAFGNVAGFETVAIET